MPVYGFSDTATLDNFVKSLLLYAGGYLFEGPTTTLSAKDIMKGYQSNMVEKVSNYSAEDIVSGDAVYYDSYVTPVITN